MPREETDRSLAISVVAAAIGLDILRSAEALSYVLLRFSRAPRRERERAEREALDDIRSIVAELIERLAPIALAQDLADARALAEALDSERALDDVRAPRGPRH